MIWFLVMLTFNPDTGVPFKQDVAQFVQNPVKDDKYSCLGIMNLLNESYDKHARANADATRRRVYCEERRTP